MRIDAHQHFWLYTPDEYAWIRTDVLKNDFTPADLSPLLADAGFDGTVAVQARWKVEETAWLLDLSDTYPFIVGVVGWLDVTGDDLMAQLERFCAHPKFCGVRGNIQTLPEDGARPTAAFIRGLQTLADFDKSFDLLIRPPQLPLACAVAEAVPALRLVLDHIANPNIDGTLAPQWVNGLRRLAAFPNVTCKVSGMVTRVTPLAPPRTAIPSPAIFRPYLDVIFDAFGPDRLMAGSDWPVCTQAATYQQTMGIVLDYVAGLSPAAQAAVLGATAKRVYNLAR
jgi:L-fuconolactonase